jgi:hypothetical protein
MSTIRFGIDNDAGTLGKVVVKIAGEDGIARLHRCLAYDHPVTAYRYLQFLLGILKSNKNLFYL